MSVRVGIELSPLACRIVELDAGLTWRLDDAETRVRQFARLPRMGPATRAKLASLRSRQVAVVAWGLRGDHLQVVVGPGSRSEMRREAIAAIRDVGVETRGTIGDVSPISPKVAGALRRPVVVALAGSAEVEAALRPLREAGIRVRSIVTPALALVSLARLRRAMAMPEMAEAYVALEENATAIALVRDGALLAAHEFSWGYLDERGEARSRDEIARRLASEVVAFLGARGLGRGAVSQICICGGLPELRSMTVPLMERLDLEVETLDSLFGIDASRLPDPVDEFRDRSAELRLAWAVAAHRPAPLNLIRDERRRETKTALTRAAVAAGVLMGVGVGWQIQHGAWWRTSSPTPPAARTTGPPPVRTPPPVARTTTPPPARRTAPPPATSVTAAPPPATSVRATPPPAASVTPLPAPARPPAPVGQVPPSTTKPAVPSVIRPPAAPAAAPSVVASAPAKPPTPTPVVVATQPAKPAPSVAAQPAAKPASSPAIARAEPPLPSSPASPETAAEPPPRVQTGAPLRTAPPALNRQARTAPPEDEVAPPPLPRQPRPAPPPVATRVEPPVRRIAPPPLPFEASLATILYAPERKLAIIDGRIVQAGDQVRGATVVDITPTAVLLRDGQGRLRQLTMGVPGG